MEIAEARQFMAANHWAVLATFRSDGRPQLSPVAVTVDGDGRAVISSQETAYKVRNLRRDPRASLCVLNQGFVGAWAQVEGTANILSLPDAMEPLVDYYRSISGEHPDWDDYRRAMQRERRVIVRIDIERVGPNRHG